MALPYPFVPVVKPAYNEDRGNSFYDTVTKSTKQKLSAYLKEDTCGRQVYLAFAGAASVNQLVNCIPILAMSFSFSFLVPIRVASGALATASAIALSITNQLADNAQSIYTPAEILSAVTLAIGSAVDADVDDDDNQLTVG